jgi:hypothetical protein
MKEVKKVDLKILGKVAVLLGVGASLIWLGVIFPLVALVVFRFNDLQMFLTFLVNMFFLAIVCGLLMALHFLIVGVVYNWVAERFGGMKVNLK